MKDILLTNLKLWNCNGSSGGDLRAEQAIGCVQFNLLPLYNRRVRRRAHWLLYKILRLVSDRTGHLSILFCALLLVCFFNLALIGYTMLFKYSKEKLCFLSCFFTKNKG
jgi:hypothetical protein